MRSGTLPTHQIVGMGEAFALAASVQDTEAARIGVLRDRLWDGLKDVPGVVLNGSATARIPHNLNVSFDVGGEISVAGQLLDIAVSAGSACNSANAAPSYVLTALGRPAALARSAIRFSLGRYTTEARNRLHRSDAAKAAAEVTQLWIGAESEVAGADDSSV
jgi:cysteine desulfurase